MAISAPKTSDSAAPPAASTRLARAGRARRLRAVVWLGVLVVVVGGAAAWMRSRKAAPIEVSTLRVERGSVRDFVTSVAAGRVAARQEALLRAEIAGTVRAIHKRRGDAVKAGDELIGYDADDLRDRLRVAESAVALARAQVKQAEQQAANAETNASRARRLRATGSISEAELDNLESQAKALMRTVEAAQAAVQQAVVNVELARNGLGKTVVRAPFAGTVLDVKTEVGETSTPGAPLVELADASELHVDVEIDEADLGRIKVGMPAELALDAFPQERFRGTLKEIAPSVTRDPRGGRSVAVDVSVAPDPRLRVGMSADVDIIVAVQKDALWVSPNAVLGRGAERAVFVVEGGVAKKRVVDVGISTWEAVEIRGGVAEHAEVISSLASGKVSDGAAVVASRGAAAK